MDPILALGVKVAFKIKDYLQHTNFSDFASFYYKKSLEDTSCKCNLAEFIEVMVEADVHPFPELNQQLDHLQMTGLIQLITSRIAPWLFENRGPEPRTVELLKSIGLEAWLFKPANRVMYILPEKEDIDSCLSRIGALEEEGLIDGSSANSNISDWKRL